MCNSSSLELGDLRMRSSRSPPLAISITRYKASWLLHERDNKTMRRKTQQATVVYITAAYVPENVFKPDDARMLEKLEKRHLGLQVLGS